jgi:SAM-dependent methyltransferase
MASPAPSPTTAGPSPVSANLPNVNPEQADMNPAEFHNIAAAEGDLWWYRGQRDILRRFLAPYIQPSPALVLEAGCGTGHNAKVLHADYGWRMVPLDLGFAGLQYARGYGVSRLCQGDLATLPFADQSFDHAVSLDVIVHFPPGREHEAFRELARVVKPGGFVIFRVSALDLLRSRHSQHASERQRFTAQRLRQAVATAGLTTLRSTYANAFLLPIALFKFRVWEPLTNAPAASGVTPVAPWLDQLLYSALRLESHCIGRGIHFPLGQSLILIAQRPGKI